VEQVTGIGGVFFRSNNPERLAQWYEDMLGVKGAPADYYESPWWQEAGSTVWAPMPADSAHFGNSGAMWTITFRVNDLAAMVTQLREAGIDVAVDPESYPNGQFAETVDPEGNSVQLWEPRGREAHKPPRS